MEAVISRRPSPASWSRDVVRSHALMAALYARADRADLMTVEMYRMELALWDEDSERAAA